ncbi:MAG TPA: hypothetical protein VG860_19210 [Terriglobia bacterium]|jgi:thiamine phosphate synthase YjbQ (UPF0047 family)|nr:hypothetical protein [Terriglobia bacterium]
MAKPAGFMVKIDASPELVGELKNVVESNPDLMKLESAGPSDQPSHLRLGLADVETLIAIVNGAVAFGQFAHSIYKHFKEKKAERLMVQTPLRTVEILSSDATSEERILELLQSSIRV